MADDLTDDYAGKKKDPDLDDPTRSAGYQADTEPRFVDYDEEFLSSLPDSDDDYPYAVDRDDTPPDPGYAAYASDLEDPLADWPSPEAPLDELPEMRGYAAPNLDTPSPTPADAPVEATMEPTPDTSLDESLDLPLGAAADVPLDELPDMNQDEGAPLDTRLDAPIDMHPAQALEPDIEASADSALDIPEETIIERVLEPLSQSLDQAVADAPDSELQLAPKEPFAGARSVPADDPPSEVSVPEFTLMPLDEPATTSVPSERLGTYEPVAEPPPESPLDAYIEPGEDAQANPSLADLAELERDALASDNPRPLADNRYESPRDRYVDSAPQHPEPEKLDDDYIDDFLNDLDDIEEDIYSGSGSGVAGSMNGDTDSSQSYSQSDSQSDSLDTSLSSAASSGSSDLGKAAAAAAMTTSVATAGNASLENAREGKSGGGGGRHGKGGAKNTDEERRFPIAMVAVVVVALALLAIGGFGVVQQRSEMQAEIRDLQSQLATTLTPEEADMERERQRQVELESEQLASEIAALGAENLELREQLQILEAQLGEQQALADAEETAAAEAKAAAELKAANAREAREASEAKAAANKAAIAARPTPAPAATSRSAPAGVWFVNFGSYAQRDVADSWAKRIASSEGEVVVSTATAGGRTLYRVRVIGLDNQDAAERVATRLEREYKLPRLWVGKNG